MERDDFRRQVREAVERETRKSRYRDSHSGERVHPVQHDIDRLVAFLCDRRSKVPGALAVARRIYQRVDTAALRRAVDIVRNEGQCSVAMERRCERILWGCGVIELALAVLLALKASDDHVH